MARRARPSSEPDLFSVVPGMALPSPAEDAPAPSPRRRRAPAADAPAPEPPPPPPPITPEAVERESAAWGDAEVERLHALLTREMRRRGLLRERPEPEAAAVPVLRQRRPETLAEGLAPGQVSAILEASQAGVTLGKIAREFGLPLAAIKRAIASSDLF